MSKQEYEDAVRAAVREHRTVDIGKVVAQMNREPIDYNGVDLGSFPVNIFVGENEGTIGIGTVDIPVHKEEAVRIIKRLEDWNKIWRR
jgi:hypothetical protein